LDLVLLLLQASFSPSHANVLILVVDQTAVLKELQTTIIMNIRKSSKYVLVKQSTTAATGSFAEVKSDIEHILLQ
jgi:hypothetical protein